MTPQSPFPPLAHLRARAGDDLRDDGAQRGPRLASKFLPTLGRLPARTMLLRRGSVAAAHGPLDAMELAACRAKPSGEMRQ
jgi:hypothetical protein